MDVLFTVLTAMMTGFVIGGAARFAVPGPDPMPFWLTVVIGLCGSAIHVSSDRDTRTTIASRFVRVIRHRPGPRLRATSPHRSAVAPSR